MDAQGGEGSMYVYGPGVKPQPEAGEGGPPSSSATSPGKTGRVTISETEAQKAQTLTVKGIDLRAFSNAVRHWTLRYEATWSDAPTTILRRGREFTLTLTFNRPFQKEQDDVIFVVSAEEDDSKPRKNLRVRFQLEEEDEADEDEGGWGRGTRKRTKDWWAVREGSQGEGEEVRCRVSIPGDCPVGFWYLQVHTQRRQDSKDVYAYVCGRPLIVLFNPWSQEDQVYFPEDHSLLEEYVLNEEGAVFMGSSDRLQAKRWHYGQFEEGVVEICVWLLRKAFNDKLTPDMGDPVLVSRALSRIVNSQDDNGVLLGNWSKDYSGGRSPQSWASSLPILRQFRDTGEPVKFGQCWVFSHTLTTVCRALGLPCRSVTNFSSAHDTDNTCTVDFFLDKDGDVLENISPDSIWNFHVWNEVWILRPDLKDDVYTASFGGWHVIDATPQERSMGMMQCGPCPVKAVRQGEVSVGYDTIFVFGEVNAEIVHWIQGTSGQFDTTSAIIHHGVGQKISTLLPRSLMPEESRVDRNSVVRMDLTGTYKHPEGSEEERRAVKRAVRYCRYGTKLFKQSSDLKVRFEEGPDMTVGSEVQLTARVSNVSGQDRQVQVTLAARATPYWDHSRNTRLLAKEQRPPQVIKAGASETFQLQISPKQYTWACSPDWNVHGFACARDVTANMPYTTQHVFTLTQPTVRVQGPASAKSGEVVTVTAVMTNPLHVPLTNCAILLDGNLTLAPDDPGTWVSKYGSQFMNFPSDFKVEPSQDMTLTVRLVGQWKGQEDKQDKTVAIVFDTLELGILMGSYDLKKAA